MGCKSLTYSGFSTSLKVVHRGFDRFQNTCAGAYRYGFQGMEADNEVSGEKNSYDFGARMYNPRIGRWMSRDAHESNYPNISPYTFVANMPIVAIDPDGKDIILLGGLKNQDAFVAKLNKEVGSKMYTHEKGILKRIDGSKEVKGVFFETIDEYMKPGIAIPLVLKENDDEFDDKSKILFDSYAGGFFDLSDFDKVSGDVYKSTLLHVLTERFATVDYQTKMFQDLQNIRNGNTNENSVPGTTIKEYEAAHKVALQKEAEFLIEKYPNLKDKIAPQGQGLSTKLDEQGVFIWDFGAVIKTFNLAPGIKSNATIMKDGGKISIPTQKVEYTNEL